MVMPSEEPLEGEARLAGAGWREIGMAALVAAVLFLAFLVIPVIGPIAVPFAPVPAVRTAHRRGMAAGLLVAGGAALLLFVATVASAGAARAGSGAVVVLVSIALPAAAAAWTRRGGRPSIAYITLAATGFVLVSAALLLRSAATGHTPGREIAAAFDEMGPAAVNRAQLDAETAARMRATLAAARDFARTFWLGLAGACWVIASAIGFYTGARLARPEESAEAARFEALRVPTLTVALFAAAGALSALAASPWRERAGNVLIPLVALYFVLGLSIICHFARKWFRVRLLRIGLYALVVYFPINVVVVLLGLFDWYADFRRRGEGALEKS
jgi:hypothetical protein